MVFELFRIDSKTITRPKRPVGVSLPEINQPGVAPNDVSNGVQPVAVVVPSVPTPVQRIESTPVRKVEQIPLKGPNDLGLRENIKKNESKQPGQRPRQKTMVVQSQLSLEIENAFKEAKEKLGDEAVAEVQRRIQSLVSIKEREWLAKQEKLMEQLDSWEHKAVERNVIVYKYSQLVKDLVDGIKLTSAKNAPSQTHPAKGLLGRPGPERTVSPDEIALLRKERDQLAEDVISWETSYDELYKRYEKLRQASIEFKQTAEETKAAYEKLQEQYDEAKKKFEILKTEAENEINRANLEMERQEELRESDSLALRLKVKRLEAKNTALTTSLDAKGLDCLRYYELLNPRNY
ncbi:unnamed protein product [Enterobius vermicularis]|uniref:TACC_C domain-containing protein n=1 Tax=Enterobius vermicularis TaxID=51028 RepID=A0A0N4V9N4_ENTVE|nr:unnamed protein product [Enterobius vermicularis]